MKSLKINRAIDSTTFFADGELLEVSKKLSIDLINYYGVDRRTAYRIFSMYMVGLFGDENNISNYVTINDGDAIRNDNALNADDNCTIDKYGKSCIANTSDTYKPFFLKKELKNNNKHTDFLFETNNQYDKLNFSFDKKRLFWKSYGEYVERNGENDYSTINNSILISDIKSLRLDRNTHPFKDDSWSLVINNNESKTIYLDYFTNLKNISDFEITPFSSALVFILNNYKNSALEPISLELSNKAAALLQNEDYWNRVKAKYGDSAIVVMEVADVVSDGVMIVSSAGAATAGVIVAKKGVTRVAIKAAAKALVSRVKSELIQSVFNLKKSFSSLSKLRKTKLSDIFKKRKKNRINKKTFEKSTSHSTQLKNSMSKICKSGEQAHHLIPINIAKKFLNKKICSDIYDKNSPLYINGINNGICLSSKKNIFSASHSGAHGKYDNQIKNYLEQDTKGSCETVKRIFNCAKESLLHQLNIADSVNNSMLVLCEK